MIRAKISENLVEFFKKDKQTRSLSVGKILTGGPPRLVNPNYIKKFISWLEYKNKKSLYLNAAKIQATFKMFY